jgi:hypothetical protein
VGAGVARENKIDSKIAQPEIIVGEAASDGDRWLAGRTAIERI